MQKEKVLITVKTYPTLSNKYDELVCTAGLREDGTWIRLYPMPFRKLDYEKQYKKYQWIKLNAKRRTQDFRMESYSPDIQSIRTLGEPLDTKNNWEKRKEIVFKAKKYKNLDKLFSDAKRGKSPISLALFKPKEILDFVAKPDDEPWKEDIVSKIKSKRRQLNLFEDNSKELLELAKKIPFKFSYRLRDVGGKESTMMIEDWEIGALYLNCIAKHNQEVAVQKVKEKYIALSQNDIYLFLGTTLQYHKIAPNPFVIVGVFYPPMEKQEKLF